jgi:hypothetical protein
VGSTDGAIVLSAPYSSRSERVTEDKISCLRFVPVRDARQRQAPADDGR